MFLNNEERQVTKALEIMLSNIYDAMKISSMGDAKYFVTFIDDFLTKVQVYMLKPKRKYLEKVKEFKALVETQSKDTIKECCSDNGGQFILEEIISIFGPS